MLVTYSRKARIFIGIALLAAVFLALRLPGIRLPYHQDEWKNVAASATVKGAGSFFAHPPLMQMLFVADYKIFGPEYFRILPLLFSLASGILLYAVVRRRAGESAALWSAGLFVICFYSVWGSLQTDVDGSVLPLFFLLAVWSYDRYVVAADTAARRTWLLALMLALLVGFLTKLSFVLVIGAVLLDYLWAHYRDMLVKRAAIAAGGTIGFGALYIAALYAIHAVYPAFDVSLMVGHANQYAGTGGRNWTQIVVQGVKAAYYLSPLMLVPLLFMSRNAWSKTRVFGLYLVAGFVFYFVLFDFSQAALDKYLMFAIVPLAAIAGVIMSETFASAQARAGRLLPRKGLAAGAILALALVALNFLPQTVAALYPKTEWFGRVAHLQWNVLTPMIGGSGPLGFYISFLFIAASFIVAASLAIAGLFRRSWRPAALAAILVMGIAYNAVFAEELLLGKINGSSSAVLAGAVDYIAGHPEITQVLTYNDTGAAPLSAMGKYAGRIYAIPASEEGYRKKFAAFGGNYMVIDIPHLYESGFYGRFFAKCTTLYETRSGKIYGRVYDCSAAKAVIDSI